ncbi:MAG: aminoglycoside 6-adenylyltransferase [Candidatus Izimaplasma sp.]|nr:aminoglycoside 6-adenylyltransferase [Candidatus Izimaplasma bacterium]
MRDRLKVLDEILQFAKNDENIRAVVLQGSLANPINRIDKLSDLDPLFYVKDISKLAFHDEWLDQFGVIITRLYDEFINDNNTKSYIKMVIYEDGLKVDFGIAPLELTNEIDKLMFYKVIIDKDSLIKPNSVTTEEKFYPLKPTALEYQTLINNFFWDVNYISKSLYREEMYFAKFMFENLNKMIRKLLSWHLGIKHNWEVNIGLEGRYLKSLLSEDLWKKVLATFSGSDISENWKAIYAMCDLVRELGSSIASELDFTYPTEQDIRIVNYLKKIEKMI